MARRGRKPKRPLSGIGKRRIARQEVPAGAAEARKSDKRWQAILAGAALAFRRLGYGNATLEDVAKEVGIDRSTLYYYVGTKAELLVAVLEEPIRQMTVDLRGICALDLPPAEKLEAAIRQHMQALSDNYPELFIFLAENLHLLPIGDERGISPNAQEYGVLMQRIIEEGMSAGAFRDDLDPQLAMLGIVGMCNWSHRWYRPEGRVSLPRIGHCFARLALEGLVAGGGRNRKARRPKPRAKR